MFVARNDDERSTTIKRTSVQTERFLLNDRMHGTNVTFYQSCLGFRGDEENP
jgi:hypothetical protein